MAKRGQHKGDSFDQTKSHGHNNPSKSVTITAGTPKKLQTYEQQAREHENPAPQAQAARNDWNEDDRKEPSHAGSTRARHTGSGRPGSASNAS